MNWLLSNSFSQKNLFVVSLSDYLIKYSVKEKWKHDVRLWIAINCYLSSRKLLKLCEIVYFIFFFLHGDFSKLKACFFMCALLNCIFLQQSLSRPVPVVGIVILRFSFFPIDSKHFPASFHSSFFQHSIYSTTLLFIPYSFVFCFFH